MKWYIIPPINPPLQAACMIEYCTIVSIVVITLMFFTGASGKAAIYLQLSPACYKTLSTADRLKERGPAPAPRDVIASDQKIRFLPNFAGKFLIKPGTIFSHFLIRVPNALTLAGFIATEESRHSNVKSLSYLGVVSKPVCSLFVIGT